MLSRYNNENGGALIYVLMVSLVLMIFVPGILSMVSATQLQDIRVINQKQTTTLAVSGMKAFLDVGDVTKQKSFLGSNYGMTSIIQTNGEQIDYYQYAVNPTDSEDYSNHIPATDFILKKTSFKTVIAAIFGDSNHNGVKDDDEKSFYKKELSHLVTIASEQTQTPTLNPLYEGELVVTGTAVPGAVIKVVRNGGEFTGTADDSGKFSIPIEPALVEGEIIKVTATIEGKAESPVVFMTVFGTNDTNTGIVKIIYDDGTVEYRGFQQVYSTDDEMVVLSSVGNYVAKDCDKKDESDSCIDLVAGNGLTIEPGVSLTTADQGNDVGITLRTTGGNITINNINLMDQANSNFSHIKIESAGDVYMESANLYATRDITIIAHGNIYAKNAVVNNGKKEGVIRFEINGNGKLYADGLQLSEAPTSAPSNICGKLSIGSELIDYGTCE